MFSDICKILIVDDEIQNRKAFLRMFSDKNFEVILATNGGEGCRIAEKYQPDIILMDWVMPIMNGIEATMRLKANMETKDIPILIVSGIMISSDNLKVALEAGACDFVPKPIDEIELIARINNSLRLSYSFQELKVKNMEVEKLARREFERSEAKDRELSVQAMQALEMDTFLQELEKDLKKAKENPNEIKLKKIIKSIKSKKEGSKGWDNFLLHFESVHPNFFAKLRLYSSSLTPNDLKLCAYMRIGMSNKEIASIRGVGNDSIKSTLYRLKGKLHLSEDEKLREFISTIR